MGNGNDRRAITRGSGKSSGSSRASRASCEKVRARQATSPGGERPLDGDISLSVEGLDVSTSDESSNWVGDVSVGSKNETGKGNVLEREGLSSSSIPDKTASEGNERSSSDISDGDLTSDNIDDDGGVSSDVVDIDSSGRGQIRSRHSEGLDGTVVTPESEDIESVVGLTSGRGSSGASEGVAVSCKGVESSGEVPLASQKIVNRGWEGATNNTVSNELREFEVFRELSVVTVKDVSSDRTGLEEDGTVGEDDTGNGSTVSRGTVVNLGLGEFISDSDSLEGGLSSSSESTSSTSGLEGQVTGSHNLEVSQPGREDITREKVRARAVLNWSVGSVTEASVRVLSESAFVVNRANATARSIGICELSFGARNFTIATATSSGSGTVITRRAGSVTDGELVVRHDAKTLRTDWVVNLKITREGVGEDGTPDNTVVTLNIGRGSKDDTGNGDGVDGKSTSRVEIPDDLRSQVFRGSLKNGGERSVLEAILVGVNVNDDGTNLLALEVVEDNTVGLGEVIGVELEDEVEVIGLLVGGREIERSGLVLLGEDFSVGLNFGESLGETEEIIEAGFNIDNRVGLDYGTTASESRGNRGVDLVLVSVSKRTDSGVTRGEGEGTDSNTSPWRGDGRALEVVVVIGVEGFSEGILEERDVTSSSDTSLNVRVGSVEVSTDEDEVIRSSAEWLSQTEWSRVWWGRRSDTVSSGVTSVTFVSVAVLVAFFALRVTVSAISARLAVRTELLVTNADTIRDASSLVAITFVFVLAVGSIVGLLSRDGTDASLGGRVANSVSSSTASGIRAGIEGGNVNGGTDSGLELEDNIVVVAVRVLKGVDVLKTDNVLVLNGEHEDLDFLVGVESVGRVEGGLGAGMITVGPDDESYVVTVDEGTNIDGDSGLKAGTSVSRLGESNVLEELKLQLVSVPVLSDNGFVIVVVEEEVTELVAITGTFPKDGDVNVGLEVSDLLVVLTSEVGEIIEDIGIPVTGVDQGIRDSSALRKESSYLGDEVLFYTSHISILGVGVTGCQNSTTLGSDRS